MNWLKLLGLLAVPPAAMAYIGCSSSSKLSCGAGTQQNGDTCVPATAALTSDAGSDAAAPATLTFAGVGGVAPASPSSLFITWSDATGSAPTSSIRYQVFVGPSGTPLDYGKPTATTEAGAHFSYIGGLTSGARYDVVVRALDPSGKNDGNTSIKSGTPAADTNPPTFGGVKTANPAGSGAVTLTWDAANDDLTPPESIVYLVYVADETKQVDYTVPYLATPPGVTTIDVTKLFQARGIYRFVVRARDAADNVDGNTTALPSRPGVDTTPPTFAGCKAAFAESAGSVVVSWDPADDEATPADKIAYDVYASTDANHFDFGKPMATVTNVTSTTVTGLTNDTTWRFVCRAKDAAGNEDQNQTQRAAHTLVDSVPPTFSGLIDATVDSSARTVVFTWAAATDDKTTPDKMVYDVYESSVSGGEVFTGPPRASSDPGALTMTVTDLTPDTTLYWVVRARDSGGNHDSNTKEANGVINVSFSRQVQPIFTHDCGVSGCHVPGNPVANMILAPGFAYKQIVNVKATESTDMRIAPTLPENSYLYKKITQNPPPVGFQMPAPATGSVLTADEKDLVRRWILQGAVEN